MSNDIVVGRRALATREAVAKASANVINTLTSVPHTTHPQLTHHREERMLQCFPEYATDYPNLILGLQQIVQHAFNHQVPVSSLYSHPDSLPLASMERGRANLRFRSKGQSTRSFIRGSRSQTSQGRSTLQYVPVR